MKVKISKSELSNGLQLVQNIVSTRTTLPILSNVLIRTMDHQLQLSTTDLDVMIRSNVKAEVVKSGACTLPVRRLAGIVRELAEGEIQIEAESKGTVSFRSGASFFKIHGLPPEEFPAAPKFEKSQKFKLSQADVKEMLKRTTFSISTDETRFVLNGLYLSFKGNKLTAVATDGRRLALVEREMEVRKEDEQEVILPTKAVMELSRLLSTEGNLEISIAESQVAFEFLRGKAGKKAAATEETGPNNEGVFLVTKQIVGKFPNYKQVIPSETKERVTIEREQLLGAVSRAGLLTTEKNNAVKMTLAKNQIIISANTPEVGEAKETLTVKYGGKEFSIGFNPGFLLEALRALDTDEVSLELTDELSPAILKINGPFLYVVMPMRMN